MIDKETLISIAKLNNLRPWQQEKHYVQTLILTTISSHPVVFKGGTYLWFFHGLNRFSEDLDFTSMGVLSENLDEKTSEMLRIFGIENSVKRVTNDDRSFAFRISSKGPLHTSDIDLCHVYVEISKREKLIETSLSFKLNVDAYALPIKIVSGMSLDEVAAEKVRAIFTRNTARDLYDLYFLIGKKQVTFNVEMINEKLKYYQINFSEKLFDAKILEKNKVWNSELKQLIFGELPTFNDGENLPFADQKAKK